MSDRALTPDLLLGAYAAGIFPMGENRDDPDVYWVDPRFRGVLPLDGFHMSRSLARRMKTERYRASLNVAFEAVLDGCAERDDTWINDTIRDLVLTLAKRDHAHAFAVWEGERLVGGMYGITLGSAFFGESMFSHDTDGSKMALAWAVDHLVRTGFSLFDTQFLTRHLASLGGVEIPRSVYHQHLQAALDTPASITKIPLEPQAQAVVQRITQMS